MFRFLEILFIYWVVFYFIKFNINEMCIRDSPPPTFQTYQLWTIICSRIWRNGLLKKRFTWNEKLLPNHLPILKTWINDTIRMWSKILSIIRLNVWSWKEIMFRNKTDFFLKNCVFFIFVLTSQHHSYVTSPHYWAGRPVYRFHL